jgi:hypothetical protein
VFFGRGGVRIRTEDVRNAPIIDVDDPAFERSEFRGTVIILR